MRVEERELLQVCYVACACSDHSSNSHPVAQDCAAMVQEWIAFLQEQGENFKPFDSPTSSLSDVN